MSVRENEYSRIVAKKSNEELLGIVKDFEKYINDFLQAAIWEIQNRKLTHPLIDGIQSKIEKEIVPAQDAVVETDKIEINTENNTQTANQVLPPLFSKMAILGFSLFFSPLTAGILLAINVSRVYKKGVIPVIIFSISYTFLQFYAAIKNPTNSSISILLSIAGALILSDVLWNKYIGRDAKFEKRSIVLPLIIALLIFVPAAVYYLGYLHPELLNK